MCFYNHFTLFPPSGGFKEQPIMCFVATSSLLLPGAVADLREALYHLHLGRHSSKRRLLRAVFPPGGPQPPSRLLGVPSCFCHVSGRRVGHFWPCGVRLVLRPGSFSADSCTEHVDNAGGGVHHAVACELLVGLLLCDDGDQPPVRILLRGSDLCGLRSVAHNCGCGAHDGGPRAAAAHRERHGTAGDTSVRYEHIEDSA